MPSQLPRIQVLLQPDQHAKLVTVSKMTRRALSHLSAEMITAALKMPKYREILEEAEEAGLAVAEQEDPRQRIPQPRIVSTFDKIAEESGGRKGDSYRRNNKAEEEEVNFSEAQLAKIAEMMAERLKAKEVVTTSSPESPKPATKRARTSGK